MKKPLVSIIIVNLNGARYLRACLAAIATIKKPACEVVIIDNHSSDSSVSLIKRWMARKPNARMILNETNEGFCRANNQGAATAQGKYLLFLNNDTEVPSHLLDVLIKKMQSDRSIGIIQPKILLKNEPGHLDSVGGFLTWTGFLNHLGIHEKDRGQYDRGFEVLSPKGACMMIGKRLFDRVGGFDEDFFAYFEETDLAWRVWLAGKRVLFDPTVSILHIMGQTTRQLNFNFIQFHSFKNRLNTLIKNLGIWSLWRAVLHSIIVFCLALFYILIGRGDSAQPILKALAWNLKMLPQTLKKRHTIQRSRKVSDAFLKTVSRPLPMRKVLHDVFWYTHQ